MDALAETGYAATTLVEIGARARVSPGLIAHYFDDKDGLLEATLRSLAARLGRSVSARLRAARNPRERVQAVIEAMLAPEEFEPRTCSVWLAFWGQVIHSARLRRVQRIYQARMLSNLRHALRQMAPRREAERIALGLAALIDGLWLRATLSNETDSRAARAMATGFVDGEIARLAALKSRAPTRSVADGRVRNHIAGHYVDARAATTFATVNPATGAVLSTVEAAGAVEIEQAVTAARAAQPEWAVQSGMERARVLRRAADILRERGGALAHLEAQDSGRPIHATAAFDVPSSANCFEHVAHLAGGPANETAGLAEAAFGYVRREPLGVLAGMGSGANPLLGAARIIAPALACGNAVIFKPADVTPLSAALLAEIMVEAGAPDGVFSVLQGSAEVGEQLLCHAGITPAPRDPARAVLVVRDDADLDTAVAGALGAVFEPMGCRREVSLFVQVGIRPAFLDRVATRAKRLKLGDPLDPMTRIGPLVSAQHLQEALDHVGKARHAGARVITGGRRVTSAGRARGFFMQPTVLEASSVAAAFAPSAIAAPIMTALPFARDEEVVAGASAAGRSAFASVFTRDIAQGHRLLTAIAADTGWINRYDGSGVFDRALIERYSRQRSVYVALPPEAAY